mgnify:CR=1 FL=1
MKLPDNKYINMIAYYIATVVAVIVAVSQFIYRAWIDNDVNDKIRVFIHQTSSIIANISTAIATETE